MDFKSTGKSLRYFKGGCCGKDELQRQLGDQGDGGSTQGRDSGDSENPVDVRNTLEVESGVLVDVRNTLEVESGGFGGCKKYFGGRIGGF